MKTVNIAKERPNYSPHNDEWVARDQNMEWHCRCNLREAKTAIEAAVKMYHARDIRTIENHGETCTVVLDLQ